MGDVDTALSSPAVEFVVFTLKADGSAEALTSLLEELGKGLDVAVGAHPPCAWGQSVEHKSKFLLVVGWDTVAVSFQFVLSILVAKLTSKPTGPLGSG